MLGTTRRLWVIAIAGALSLSGPALAKGKQDRPKETAVVKEGKITVVRGLRGPEPQITDANGTRWLIIGALREEVLRLGGHQLRVWAATGAKKKLMTPTLEVTRYEILDSGGRKPVVGILRRSKNARRFSLEGKNGSLSIMAKNRSLENRLTQRVNCKIWVVGEMEGTTLIVGKFGWITCKPPKAFKPGKESTK